MSISRDSTASEHVAILDLALPEAPAAGTDCDAPVTLSTGPQTGADPAGIVQPVLIRRFAPSDLDSEDLAVAIRHLLELDNAA